jgi:hypothetical protein
MATDRLNQQGTVRLSCDMKPGPTRSLPEWMGPMQKLPKGKINKLVPLPNHADANGSATFFRCQLLLLFLWRYWKNPESRAGAIAPSCF